MPLVRRGKPAIRPSAPSLKVRTLGFTSASTPIAPSNNNLFQEFIKIFIKKIQAPAAPATLVEVRNNADRPFKPRNSDLYYSHLHIEYYYFCQQYKDYFEVAKSLSHKRIPFTARFLKNCIFNQWQQQKTHMQRNQFTFMAWDKFKAFLMKSLGESNAFVGHI